MAPDLALRRALVETGGIEPVKDATSDAWVGNALASASREFAMPCARCAGPSILAVAVGTLAIGIGGLPPCSPSSARALFSARFLGWPAPIDSSRSSASTNDGGVGIWLSHSQLSGLPRPSRTDDGADGIAGFDGGAMVVEDSSGSAREWISFVTENFFTVLGVRPAAGRFFTDPESENVVVLSSPSGSEGSRIPTRARGDDRAGRPRVHGDRRRTTGFIGGMAGTRGMAIFVPIVVAARPSPILGFNLESRRGGLMRLVGQLSSGQDG